MTEPVDRARAFSVRLRSDTADLHAAVEAAADLPASVRTWSDYADLLGTFYVAQERIESALLWPERRPGWLQRDIDITRHAQLDALVDDLAVLGCRPEARAADGPLLLSPLEALGCLYVVEGSAIGRRVLSPLLQQRLGDIPTRFFDGVARHPQVWRSVQRALVDVTDPDEQAVVARGARIAFQIFLDQLVRRADRHRMSPA